MFNCDCTDQSKQAKLTARSSTIKKPNSSRGMDYLKDIVTYTTEDTDQGAKENFIKEVKFNHLKLDGLIYPWIKITCYKIKQNNRNKELTVLYIQNKK